MAKRVQFRRGDLRAAPALSAEFYRRDASIVARELLGKALVVQQGRDLVAVAITETEAYLGASDPASHTYRGETLRNSAMFRRGGTCYVYLSYGINFCMNVVTMDEGEGQGVLLRSAEPVYGMTLMAARRGLDLGGTPRQMRQVLNGPGKLTAALGVSLADNGDSYFGPRLKLVDLGQTLGGHAIAASPRIGISKAKDELLRFCVAGSDWLSR